MEYRQGGDATRLARYFLCAMMAVVTAGCGGSGSSSGSPPPTQGDGGAPAPQAVTISGTPVTTVAAGANYSFQPSASHTGTDALVFSIDNTPSWASFHTDTGLLTGTPSASDVGNSKSITITVSDGHTTAHLAAFVIAVTPPATPTPTNSPPTISGTPVLSVAAGANYAFQPSASDPDGQQLTFSIDNKPSWASFSAASGLLSGTPATKDVGTFSNIVISVSDGSKTAALPAFNIAVTAVTTPPTNSPPKISGSPLTSVQAGTIYSFQPTASDADGNTLTFAIVGKPAWATFDPTNGHLTGTPATGDVGVNSNITISVTDGKASAALPSFSITVTAPTSIPPTISGTPSANAQVGVAYSFTPTAHDPNGKKLSFSVQNKPKWAAFSLTSGALSGTPGNTDAGIYAGIVITASNGATSAALAPFTITVAPATTPPTGGTATLTWTAPTTNTDGSTITNLAGYVISYGNSATSLSQTVSVNNPATTTYTISNLSTGTWYFAVAATEADGATSAQSAPPVSKTIH